MSNNHSARVINTIMWVLIIVFCFFLIALYCRDWFSSIQLSKEVVPLDVASLLLTSLVTIFLGYYITKKLTESRVEKDSLIEDLKEIESDVCKIQDILKNFSSIGVEQISLELNMMALRINRFKKSLKIVDEKTITTSVLESHFFSLYTLSTDFDGAEVDVKSIPDGKILQICDDVILEIRGLIHAINIR